MYLTPNEAKRLGVKKMQTLSLNPDSGLNSYTEFPDEEWHSLTPNRFASLGVIHI